MKNAEQTKNSLAAFLVSRIAALRVRNNLSQRELSLRIGKESSYINRLEQSKFLPSVDTLYDIAEVCNSSLEELRALRGRPRTSHPSRLSFQRKERVAHPLFASKITACLRRQSILPGSKKAASLRAAHFRFRLHARFFAGNCAADKRGQGKPARVYAFKISDCLFCIRFVGFSGKTPAAAAQSGMRALFTAAPSARARFSASAACRNRGSARLPPFYRRTSRRSRGIPPRFPAR